MAKIHVLEAPDNDAWRLVFHFRVPNQVNSIGIPFSEAIVKSGFGGKTVLPVGDGSKGTISQAELDEILGGDVFEQVFTTNVETEGTTEEERQATLEKMWNSQNPIVQERIAEALRYWGATLES